MLTNEENDGTNILQKVSNKYELLFTKILDKLDIIVFEPITREKYFDESNKENLSKNDLYMLEKYGKLNEEVFEVPSELYYKKIGHDKISLDSCAKKHYRRYFDRPLEEVNLKISADINEDEYLTFKIPINNKEMKLIERMDFITSIDQDILYELKSQREDEKLFVFKSTFKKEYILRGKTNFEKRKNFIFDSMRDPLKYIFINDKDYLKSINFDDVYGNQNSQFDNQRENLAMKKKLSKGEFLYLARIYNKSLFERNLKILEEIYKMKEERRRIKGNLVNINFLLYCILN